MELTSLFIIFIVLWMDFTSSQDGNEVNIIEAAVGLIPASSEPESATDGSLETDGYSHGNRETIVQAAENPTSTFSDTDSDNYATVETVRCLNISCMEKLFTALNETLKSGAVLTVLEVFAEICQLKLLKNTPSGTVVTENPRTKGNTLSTSKLTALCIGAGAGILVVSLAVANKRFICDLCRKARKLLYRNNGYHKARKTTRSNTPFIDEETNEQDKNGDVDESLVEKTSLTDSNLCTIKFEDNETKNLVTSLYRQSGSQTHETQCHPKKTIFGKPFKHTSFIDRSNSIVQGPYSDVRMKIPTSVANKETIEVKWTTFSDILALNEKLGLGPCFRLASPVVEYSIKGHTSFPEHACIIMPFLGPSDDISVCYFKSDEGLNQTVNTINIPHQTKENLDLDVFYVIQDNKLVIYTRHCSGYFCKKKHCREIIGFRGLLYGTFGKVNREHSVAVSFYVADELFIFKDYEQRLRKDEIETKKRTALDNFSITLSTDLHHNDYFETGIVFYDTAFWTHKRHPLRNEPIYPDKQKLRLEELVKQCTECRHLVQQVNEIPKRFDWSLNTIANQTPNDVFRFIIDMWTSTERGELKERLNSKEINCLELKKQDRLPKEEVQGAMMHPNYTEPDQGQWPLGAVGRIGARECPAPELSNPCHSSQPSEIHN